MELLVGVITVLITLYIARSIQLNDSLDSKSGWRKELFNVASKEKLTMDEVYRIRAALRYYPNYLENKNNNIRPYEFTFMSDLFSEMCNHEDLFINQKRRCEEDAQLLSRKGAELVRIMARYLLKIHWESRRRLVISGFNDDQMDVKLPNDEIIGVQTIKLIDEVVDDKEILEDILEKMDSKNREKSRNNKNSTTIVEMIEEKYKYSKNMNNKIRKNNRCIVLSLLVVFVTLISLVTLSWCLHNLKFYVDKEFEYGLIFVIIFIIIAFFIETIYIKINENK
ncbi:hypothetical protein [Ligilactobacillus salivarius]